jgi:uncharacterized protein
MWGILGTAPLVLALFWILGRSAGTLRHLVEFAVDQLGPMVGHRSAAELAVLAAAAGLGEELLFRGVLQNGLTRLLSPSLALVFTSLAFGLAHYLTRTYAVVAGIMGLYLGGIYLLQHNLLAPIITHGLYDFVALLLLAERYRTRKAARL